MATFVNSSIALANAPAISTVVTNATGASRPQLLVHVVIAGTVTNTSLDVSVGFVDGAGVTVWHGIQTLAIRTLPDATKTTDLASFDVFSATTAFISLETTITGGGTITLQYAFV